MPDLDEARMVHNENIKPKRLSAGKDALDYCNRVEKGFDDYRTVLVQETIHAAENYRNQIADFALAGEADFDKQCKDFEAGNIKGLTDLMLELRQVTESKTQLQRLIEETRAQSEKDMRQSKTGTQTVDFSNCLRQKSASAQVKSLRIEKSLDDLFEEEAKSPEALTHRLKAEGLAKAKAKAAKEQVKVAQANTLTSGRSAGK